MKKWIFFSMVSIAFAACGGGGNAATEFTVTMNEFSFEPANITVPAGAQVSLNLSNEGTLEHNWVMMESGYRVDTAFTEDDQNHIFFEQQQTPPGESVSVVFSAPDQAGEYQLVCSIPGHFESGMQGRVTVTE